jgi:hypothetical protein
MFIFVKPNGSLVLLHDCALFVAMTKEAAERSVQRISELVGEPVTFVEADEVHSSGLTFLRKNRSKTYYGPDENVRLAFRKCETAKSFIERHNMPFKTSQVS